MVWLKDKLYKYVCIYVILYICIDVIYTNYYVFPNQGSSVN